MLPCARRRKACARASKVVHENRPAHARLNATRARARIAGGFGNNILGFILPPLFYYKLRVHEGYWTQPSRARLAELTAIVVTATFGVFFLVLTLIFFGKAIIDKS